MASTDRQVYSGRYELRSKLARGGMADVFLSNDLLLDRPVALKVLFPEFSTDPAFVQRFRREAQAAGRLNHPNVVAVFDWGQEGTTYFIVMEYVEGHSLAEVIRSDGRLQPDRAAAIAADVADALAFAHRGGVVHRDVKPGNVLLTSSGHVKVADFGIARAISAQENLTQAGTVMGTATYFSPEQARGDAVDARSDVYSLGVVLYEMLTGVPPFSGENPVSVAYKQVQEAPVPPRQRVAEVPAALEAVVLKAMAKDPAERYPSAEAMRADLLAFRAGRPVGAAVLPVALPGAVDPPTTTVPLAAGSPTTAVPLEPRTQAVRRTTYDDPPPPLPEESRGGRRALLVLALLALLAAIVGGGWLLLDSLGFVGGPDRVVVPDTVGQTQEDAEATLRDEGFEVLIEQRSDETALVGVVVEQDPEQGRRIDEGSEVTLTVSTGRAPVAVPSVVGVPEEEALAQLLQAELGNNVTREASEDVEEGVVISQDPTGGEVAPGSVVNLVVSAGPPPRGVPQVVGRSEGEAFGLLEDAGFNPRVLRREVNSAAAGTVVDQAPEPGTSQEAGTTISLVISSGPPATTTTTTTTTVPEETTTTTSDGGTTTTTDGGSS